MKHLVIPNNFCFWDMSILLQDVSLEYLFLTGIKQNKPFLFQRNIAVFQKFYESFSYLRHDIDSLNDNATQKLTTF